MLPDDTRGLIERREGGDGRCRVGQDGVCRILASADDKVDYRRNFDEVLRIL